MADTIALLTDFGTQDIFVGVMKGVMTEICPQARFIDITHAIQPQNVRQAAFSLLNAYPFFEAGTVFLAVVDPGVGSTRIPLAVQTRDYTFVAPDNGLLSYVLDDLGENSEVVAVELANPDFQLTAVSNTFHGRDIFAPAAAYLATGVPLADFGPVLDKVFSLPLPSLNVSDTRVMGEVMHIDQFGNIITSIGELRWVAPEKLRLTPRFGSRKGDSIPVLASDVTITIHNEAVHTIRQAYSEAARGNLLALVGSNGYLEIAVNQGNAASRLDVSIGDRVELQPGDIDGAIRH